VKRVALGRGAQVVAWWAVASGLVGCQVGPNYRSPILPNGADTTLVSLDAKLETPTQTPAAWWRLYNDPQLDALVHEALTANRDLRAANANLAAARVAVAVVSADRYPSTEAIAGGVYGRDPVTDEILEIDGHRPQTLWLFEDIFQASYEVDLSGRIHRAIEQANATAESIAAIRDGVSVVVAAQTARTYAQVCALGEQLAVARHSLEIVTREAEITQRRYADGGNSEFEVERAQALADEVRATIPQLEGLRRVALFELTALLGRTPTGAPRELDSCSEPPRLTALIPVGDGRMLISRRPDVHQAERRLAAATARIGVATADLYPTIRLSAFYGGAATEVPQLGTNVGLAWGVGPSISWTFPNEVRARAQLKASRAAQAAVLASFDSVVLTALKETEEALAAYSAVLNQRQALVDAQRRIHRSLDIARDEFAAGSLSSLDLLTTEQSLVALDAAVAASDTSLIEDQIAVFKALGGGWQRDALSPIIK
jgi:NodT family efflux transporter outer membrane factor (OMF) lipoprotein